MISGLAILSDSLADPESLFWMLWGAYPPKSFAYISKLLSDFASLCIIERFKTDVACLHKSCSDLFIIIIISLLTMGGTGDHSSQYG